MSQLGILEWKISSLVSTYRRMTCKSRCVGSDKYLWLPTLCGVKVLVNVAIGMTQCSVEEANVNGLRLVLFRRSSSVHKVNSFKKIRNIPIATPLGVWRWLITAGRNIRSSGNQRQDRKDAAICHRYIVSGRGGFSWWAGASMGVQKGCSFIGERKASLNQPISPLSTDPSEHRKKVPGQQIIWKRKTRRPYPCCARVELKSACDIPRG